MPANDLLARFRLCLSRIIRLQHLRLRQWHGACAHGTIVLVILWIAGLLVMASGPAWPPLWVAVALPTSLMPLLIAFYWLIPVPGIWNINGNWIALAVFVGSAAFALIGRWFAALTLNDIFHDSPGFFPIAQATATAIGAVLGVIAVVAGLALILVGFASTLILLLGMLGVGSLWPAVKAVVILLLVAMFSGFAIGSLDTLERLGRDAVFRMALQGDFFTRHRCGMDEWPGGITRVAFVGDQQILGYHSDTRTLTLLPCLRIQD